MARRKVGAMNTTTLVVLGIAAVGILYLMTRPQVQTIQTSAGTLVTGPGGMTTLLPANQTAQDIAATSSGLSSLANTLANQGIIGN
jgi:hypothetical protein